LHLKTFNSWKNILLAEASLSQWVWWNSSLWCRIYTLFIPLFLYILLLKEYFSKIFSFQIFFQNILHPSFTFNHHFYEEFYLRFLQKYFIKNILLEFLSWVRRFHHKIYHTKMRNLQCSEK